MLWWGLWSRDASLDGCCWELPSSLSCFLPANSFPPRLTFPTELAGNGLFTTFLAWKLAGIMCDFFAYAALNHLWQYKDGQCQGSGWWWWVLIAFLHWVLEKSHQWAGRCIQKWPRLCQAPQLIPTHFARWFLALDLHTEAPWEEAEPPVCLACPSSSLLGVFCAQSTGRVLKADHLGPSLHHLHPSTWRWSNCSNLGGKEPTPSWEKLTHWFVCHLHLKWKKRNTKDLATKTRGVGRGQKNSVNSCRGEKRGGLVPVALEGRVAESVLAGKLHRWEAHLFQQRTSRRFRP